MKNRWIMILAIIGIVLIGTTGEFELDESYFGVKRIR